LLLLGVIGQAAAIVAPPDAEGAPEGATPMVILVYTAPPSAIWTPSPGSPSVFAFGQPARVLQILPGGYVVQQELPLEQARVHAAYVSQQLGQPVTITIPDPAGGPTRIEEIGTARGDTGR